MKNLMLILMVVLISCEKEIPIAEKSLKPISLANTTWYNTTEYDTRYVSESTYELTDSMLFASINIYTDMEAFKIGVPEVSAMDHDIVYKISSDTFRITYLNTKISEWYLLTQYDDSLVFEGPIDTMVWYKEKSKISFEHYESNSITSKSKVNERLNK
jgi:hypothetical protein